MKTLRTEKIHETVKQHYAAIARENGHCCGSSRCCSAGQHEAGDNGLGCGDPVTIAKIQPGETVLDLGSGAGRDCVRAARQVGSQGRVIGVDMTGEMIAKARANAVRGAHTNVEFRLGKIEELPVRTATVDVVISNCVVNLSPDKPSAFAEAFRVLRPGGRLVISDIVATEPLPADVRRDAALWSGCVGAAATVEEVQSMLTKAGFRDVSVTIQSGCENLAWLEGVASATITARKPAEPTTRRTAGLARRLWANRSAFELPAAPKLPSFRL